LRSARGQQIETVGRQRWIASRIDRSADSDGSTSRSGRADSVEGVAGIACRDNDHDAGFHCPVDRNDIRVGFTTKWGAERDIQHIDQTIIGVAIAIRVNRVIDSTGEEGRGATTAKRFFRATSVAPGATPGATLKSLNDTLPENGPR
jgi:hypothetical protein